MNKKIFEYFFIQLEIEGFYYNISIWCRLLSQNEKFFKRKSILPRFSSPLVFLLFTFFLFVICICIIKHIWDDFPVIYLYFLRICDTLYKLSKYVFFFFFHYTNNKRTVIYYSDSVWWLLWFMNRNKKSQ